MKNILETKRRIVLWDIETRPIEVYTWGLTQYQKRLPHTNIITDWHVLCAAWKDLGSKKVNSVTCFDSGKKDDDYNVIKTLRDEFDDVDILIHHYGDKFDLPKFNARLIYHRLPPLPRILTIDTKLLIDKIAQFTSHKLDYLSVIFGFKGKIQTDFDLWIRTIKGPLAEREKAMAEMEKYCKKDVEELENVYTVLRPYLIGHPVIASPFTNNCPKCDSPDVIAHKTRASAQGIYRQQFQCKSCGGYFTTRKSLPGKSISK